MEIINCAGPTFKRLEVLEPGDVFRLIDDAGGTKKRTQYGAYYMLIDLDIDAEVDESELPVVELTGSESGSVTTLPKTVSVVKKEASLSIDN